ncbi:MAG: FtsX-like permease family protein [Actinobacteria bacterium]|nr:FtsX-like permease family protein [Actinomycetota bacterium]
MFKLSLKNIWSRKGRMVLTALAVIAGTAFLSGVFVFTDTINGSFNRMFADAFKGTDAYVRSSNVIEGDFGQETRDRISLDLVDIVRTVPGVIEANGDVFGFATVAFDGKVLGQDGPPKFGGAWIDGEGSPWGLYTGRPPVGPSEVVLDRASSKTAGVEVGDVVSITSTGQPREFTVVGIALFAGNDTSGGASWALFDLPTAQDIVIGDLDKIDSVYVRSDGSVSDQDLAVSIEAAIGDPEIEVLTGAEITKENQTAVEEALGFITIFLSVFALLSLFVGSFIIYNVFSISAAQRQSENALLRAIGASQGQVIRSMFTEAFVVGIGGSLIGCLGGVGLATVILGFLNAVGFGPGDTQLVLNYTGFVITVIVGVFVTLVCAISPAVRAGRVPPLAAMRDLAIDRAAVSTTRKVLGGLAVVSAIAQVFAGLRGDALWLGGGVVSLFVALIALGPFVAAPVARLAAPALGRVRGAAGTMSGRNAARNPKRTALTAGALAVGLSLLIGVATLGASAKESTRAIIGEAFESDYVVSPEQSNAELGVPPTIAAEIKAAGIGDALGLAAAMVSVLEDGEFRDKGVLAVSAVDAQAVLQLTFVDGGFDALDSSGILYSVDKADRDGIVVGEQVTVKLLDGTRVDLTVQGIFDADVFGNLIVERSLFDGQSFPLFDLAVFVRSNDGVTAGGTAALRAVVEAYPTAKLQSREEYIDEQSGQIDGFLNFIYALLGMSIFIAVIGIVITLWLAVYERRRELGLLRAVGMTKRQVRSSVLWESMITGVVGVILGTVLGVALGWIIVKAFADQGLSVFSLPISTIAIAVCLALVLSAMAAFIPARKASNADMLQAIATT